jgi:hypothetical protein
VSSPKDAGPRESYEPDQRNLRLPTIPRGFVDDFRDQQNVASAEIAEWTERLSGRIPRRSKNAAAIGGC